jgi:hypothetical protein
MVRSSYKAAEFFIASMLAERRAQAALHGASAAA